MLENKVATVPGTPDDAVIPLPPTEGWKYLSLLFFFAFFSCYFLEFFELSFFFRLTKLQDDVRDLHKKYEEVDAKLVKQKAEIMDALPAVVDQQMQAKCKLCGQMFIKWNLTDRDVCKVCSKARNNAYQAKHRAAKAAAKEASKEPPKEQEKEPEKNFEDAAL